MHRAACTVMQERIQQFFPLVHSLQVKELGGEKGRAGVGVFSLTTYVSKNIF